MKKRVDKTVPRMEIMKASDRRALFLPTTTNPARYKTAIKTKRFTRKSVTEKSKRVSSGMIFHHGSSPLAVMLRIPSSKA